MLERFKGHDNKIMVAVKLNPPDENFIRSVINLSNVTGMHLRFVHVIEPLTSAKALYPGEYISASIAKLAEEKRIADAQKELHGLLEPLLDGVNYDITVTLGRPVESLIADAITSQVELVVCGIQPHFHRFTPKGFSTPLGLAASSPAPTLILPHGKTADILSAKIIACDDLSEASSGVIPVAVDFAIGLGHSEVHHFHVYEDTIDEVKDWADQMNQLLLTSDRDYDVVFNRKTIIKDTERSLSKVMTERLPLSEAYLNKKHVIYKQDVSFGDFHSQLMQLMDNVQPNFIIFGRHHFIHKHPIAIGKVPFYAMLNLETPVLIVPSTSHKL